MSENTKFTAEEVFQMFDHKNKGRVSTENIGDLLRAVGQNPSLAEISEIQSNYGDKKEIDISEYKSLLQEYTKTHPRKETVEDFVKGFEIFDTESVGYIGIDQLRYVLTCLGEKLSSEEFDELMRSMDVRDEKVNYRGLIEALLAS